MQTKSIFNWTVFHEIKPHRSKLDLILKHITYQTHTQQPLQTSGFKVRTKIWLLWICHYWWKVHMKVPIVLRGKDKRVMLSKRAQRMYPWTYVSLNACTCTCKTFRDYPCARFFVLIKFLEITIFFHISNRKKNITGE